jgi:hypothetical protein
VEGEWRGLADKQALRLARSEGDVELRLDDLAEIELLWRAQSSRIGDESFFLADGGRLFGELLSGTEDAVTANTLLGENTKLSFTDLTAIQLVQSDSYARANELFAAALTSRLPGQDVLITREEEEPKALRGRVQSLAVRDEGDDVSRGTFFLGERERTFRMDKIFGVVFAIGPGKTPSYPVTIEFNEGSTVSGVIQSSDDETIKLLTSINMTAEQPLSSVRRITFRSERVVYLSDLTPVEEKQEGRIGPPSPIQRDRNVAGGPIRIAGRSFPKGLGMRSRAEVVYSLNGAYETFAATVGLDDGVRPRGCVIFRVFGDGREWFDSGLLTGADEPKDVHVSVVGVMRLTLTVDYGDELDLSDYADWGGARLVKAAGRRGS